MIPLLFYGVRHPDLFRRSLSVSLRAGWPGPLSITVFTDLLDPEPIVEDVKQLAVGVSAKVVHTADSLGAAFLTTTPWVAQHEAVLVGQGTYDTLISAAKKHGAASAQLYCCPASAFTRTAGNLSRKHFEAALRRPEPEFTTGLVARTNITVPAVEAGSAILMDTTLPIARYACPERSTELVNYRTHIDKVVYDAN